MVVVLLMYAVGILTLGNVLGEKFRVARKQTFRIY